MSGECTSGLQSPCSSTQKIADSSGTHGPSGTLQPQLGLQPMPPEQHFQQQCCNQCHALIHVNPRASINFFFVPGGNNPKRTHNLTKQSCTGRALRQPDGNGYCSTRPSAPCSSDSCPQNFHTQKPGSQSSVQPHGSRVMGSILIAIILQLCSRLPRLQATEGHLKKILCLQVAG